MVAVVVTTANPGADADVIAGSWETVWLDDEET